jgi:hypothetical protein
MRYLATQEDLGADIEKEIIAKDYDECLEKIEALTRNGTFNRGGPQINIYDAMSAWEGAVVTILADKS